MFFTTDTIKSTLVGGQKKLKIIMSKDVKPREYLTDLEHFRGIEKRPTRKVQGPFFSSSLTDLAEAKKRAIVAEEKRIAQAKIAADNKPKKRADRPKKGK